MACKGTDEKEVNLVTKPLHSVKKGKNFIRRIVHYVFRSEEDRNVEKQALCDNSEFQLFVFCKVSL